METKHNIKTIRLIRNVSATSERIVIKEFFRFIGCFVHDQPVSSWSEFKDIVFTPSNHDVDIILNITIENKISNPYILKRTKGIFLDYSLADKQYNIINIEDDSGKSPQYFEQKRDLNEAVINSLIQQIWNEKDNEESSARLKEIQESLKELNRLYSNNNLIGYLQNKRAFRVLNMREVREYGGKEYKISSESEYVREMLKAFNRIYESEIKPTTIYTEYAKINAARKIREVYKLLDDIPNEVTISPNVFWTDELLEKLEKIYNDDPTYISIFLLAANICQSDANAEYKLQAMEYLNQVSKDANCSDVFLAFVKYQQGLHIEKTRKNLDVAADYYQDAVESDKQCYQARFKIAYCKAEKGNLIGALSNYQEVNRIITSRNVKRDGLSGLCLKELQYVYKTSIRIAKLQYYMNNKANVKEYLIKAMNAAKEYAENECLAFVFDDSEKINEYHRESIPVDILFSLLYKLAVLYGYSDLADWASSYMKNRQ